MLRPRMYYAHCMAFYDTPQKKKDMKTLIRRHKG